MLYIIIINTCFYYVIKMNNTYIMLKTFQTVKFTAFRLHR